MKKLYPSVKNLKIIPDYFSYDYLKVYIKNECENVKKANFYPEKVSVFINCKDLWKSKLKDLEIVRDERDANIILDLDSKYGNEGYNIKIDNNLIKIYYGNIGGAYYSLKTLEQILSNEKVNNLEIVDEPKIKTRGLMLDISRDKVAKIDTIKQILD